MLRSRQADSEPCPWGRRRGRVVAVIRVQRETRTAAGGLSARVNGDPECRGPGITCVTGGPGDPCEDGRPRRRSARADGALQEEVPRPEHLEPGTCM